LQMYIRTSKDRFTKNMKLVFKFLVDLSLLYQAVRKTHVLKIDIGTMVEFEMEVDFEHKLHLSNPVFTGTNTYLQT